MIKSFQPQEEARTRLGWKTCLYSVVSERVSLYATQCHSEKHQDGWRAEGTGADERLKQQPLLGFPRENEGRAK